jgi:shikimate kinase
MNTTFDRVTFIGMCGVGKSNIARKLHKRLGDKLVVLDIDELIVVQRRAQSLQEVVASMSPERFTELEGEMTIHAVNSMHGPTIIAPGGSIIYHERAMEILRRETHIIYLRASLETIERRVARKPDRGIVFKPGETLADIYARRTPLYERWADETIDCDGKRKKVANKLAPRFVLESSLV